MKKRAGAADTGAGGLVLRDWRIDVAAGGQLFLELAGSSEPSQAGVWLVLFNLSVRPDRCQEVGEFLERHRVRGAKRPGREGEVQTLLEANLHEEETSDGAQPALFWLPTERPRAKARVLVGDTLFQPRSATQSVSLREHLLGAEWATSLFSPFLLNQAH